MKKKYLFVIAFILFTSNYSFADSSIYNLYLKNSSGITKTLTLGYDPFGTDGLDTALGEVSLPPYGTSYDARFRLPGDTSITSYKDIRYGCGQSFSYTFNIEWKNDPQIILTGDHMSMGNRVELIELIDPNTGTILKTFEFIYNDTVNYTFPFFYNKVKMRVQYSGPLTWPSYSLWQPNGGEVLQAGSNYLITWEPQGLTPSVRLSFSSNGGATWDSLAVQSGAYSSYLWQVPNISFGNCRVLIGTYPCAYDFSDGGFIIYQGTPPVLQPIQFTASLTNGTGITKQLVLGLHPNATDDLDTVLGEASSSFTPVGTFDALCRLGSGWNGSNILSKKDIKAGHTAYTGPKSYIFAVQPSADSILSFNCTVPEGVSVRLKHHYRYSNNRVHVDTLLGTGNISYTFPPRTFFNDLYYRISLLCSFENITPVEMNTFTSTVTDNCVNLLWSTASEINNKGFEVQRRSGAYDEWKSVAFISGHGTTTVLNNYTFTDKNLSVGEWYYRLKQIDNDGTYKITEEIKAEITNPAVFKLEQNYPNPFNPSTKIKYSIPAESIVNITIYNILGEKVTELFNGVQIQGYYELDCNLSAYSSGMYVYTLSAQSTGSSRLYSNSKKMIFLR